MMNQNSHPIDFVIEFAWANGCNRFIINNAKDELRKLREQIQESINRATQNEKQTMQG